MHLRRLSDYVRLLPIVASLAAPGTVLAEPVRPVTDPQRIVNESLGFLKDREPAMTEAEYALYERVIPMVTQQPDLVLTLLGGLADDAEPESPAFEFALGNVYYSRGDVAKAEQHFRRAVERFPEFLRAWSNLGLLYYGEERWEDAARCLSRTLALGERNPQTLGALGYCLYRSGNPVAAELVYLQALAVEPDNVIWITSLLELLLAQGDHPRAEALARSLVRWQPTEASHWTRYGGLLAQAGRREEAVALLEMARRLGAADSAAHLLLGDLYSEQGRHAEASAAYAKAGPAAETWSRRLAEVRRLIAEGELEPARRLLDELGEGESAEQRVEHRLVLADWHAASGNPASALAALEQALSLRPLDGDLQLALGRLAEEAADEPRARSAYAAAARQAEHAYEANIRLANLALRARDPAGCLRHLEAALQIERSPSLLRHLERVKAFLVPAATDSTRHGSTPTD